MIVRTEQKPPVPLPRGKKNEIKKQKNANRRFNDRIED